MICRTLLTFDFLDESRDELRFWSNANRPDCKNSFEKLSNKNFLLIFIDDLIDREIIQTITHLPMKMFTSSVMETAIDCWSWALVGRPELEILVKTKDVHVEFPVFLSIDFGLDRSRNLSSLGQFDLKFTRFIFHRTSRFIASFNQRKTSIKSGHVVDQFASNISQSEHLFFVDDELDP